MINKITERIQIAWYTALSGFAFVFWGVIVILVLVGTAFLLKNFVRWLIY